MNGSAFMEKLKNLFAKYDTDNDGRLGKLEFKELCNEIGLNEEAINETFERLDIDKNDYITFDEFAAGFNQYQQTSRESPCHSPSPPIEDCDQACGSGQFSSLVSSGSGSITQVRNMQDLLDCVQKLQNENQILSQIFFKDKREREEYINQLGEEFDQQVKEVEERATRRAKEEIESEKRRLREMMQTERETLQHHYETIEKMSKLIRSQNGQLDDEETIDKVRTKLEDTYLENRQLKKSLLDTKTDVALIWKEMEKLKKQYEHKLSSAYERHNETREECDHIKQQLDLMKDSNRKLQDASDVITNYITDKVEPVIKNATDNEDDTNYLVANRLSPLARSRPTSGPENRKGSILSNYLDSPSDPVVEPADGPSKTTFNIILVGDSFVGKSSFATRFIEGNFVPSLISSCSIDFKTKSYKVDGVNYTINLWDTVGQERFKSMTASYFRRANGIILMYDVTERRSYLNVRNWMSTIAESASENVAVLLVGNKIDLRGPDNVDTCVPTEEGFRLAREYDIVFLETSVKTGLNLAPTMGKLIRLIAKINTPEEEDKDRIKLNDKSKKFNCMPNKC